MISQETCRSALPALRSSGFLSGASPGNGALTATSTSQLAGYAGLDPLKHSSTGAGLPGATSSAIPLWRLRLRGWVHGLSVT
jgi:hypothetical protein